jgi:phosphate transport system substrate-binding protein
MKQNPTIVNIPLAISAQTINYNLPGLNSTHLKLDGPTLAGIYGGTITKWNDAKIKALNPSVKLPDHAIVPIHRADGSGDTFIFTQYLSFSTPSWSSGPGYGTTVSWAPVQGAVGATGNPGMVQSTQQTPYSISYIGVSFHDQIKSAGLGTAMLKNRSGQFLLPTSATVNAAANEMVAKTPVDQRISLIFAPGANSYPIVNYEYAIVKTTQANGDMTRELKNFLTWTLSGNGGSDTKFLQQVRFVKLPAKIVGLSQAQIAKIQ